jgi:phage shock protein C
MSEANMSWRRSRDRMIGGVCGGIAERLGWPKDRLRVAVAIATILTGGVFGIVAYLLLWFVMPPPGEPGLTAPRDHEAPRS